MDTEKYMNFDVIVDYLNLGNFEYRNSMLKILEVARVQNRIIILAGANFSRIHLPFLNVRTIGSIPRLGNRFNDRAIMVVVSN